MGIRKALVGEVDGDLYQVVDLSVDAGVTIPGPVLLKGVYVNTVMSAHTVLLKDGATTVFTLPASLAAGSERNFGSRDGVEFLTSIVVTPNVSSTGNITIAYRPLN